VRRLTSLLVALGLLSSAAHAGLLHIHAYWDHDHPEHHHGPAVHTHAAAEEPSSDLRIDRCDPGQHTSSFVFICGAPQSNQVSAPAESVSGVIVPSAPVVGGVSFREVRVHGPPRYSAAGLRAPPLSASA